MTIQMLGDALVLKHVMISIYNKNKMNKYIITLCLLISGHIFSQVTVGKSTATTAPATVSVVIEFGDATGGLRGIVLPWVTATSDVTGAVPGTLVFDTSATQQKVKFARANVANSTTVFEWFDLSNGAFLPNPVISPDAGTDISTAKTLIGGTPSSDTTSGILVLGDTDKAMVLPRVNSYTDIVNPSAGMMVYVTGTTPQQLAVYNGKEWSFWKP